MESPLRQPLPDPYSNVNLLFIFMRLPHHLRGLTRGEAEEEQRAAQAIEGVWPWLGLGSIERGVRVRV